MFLLKSRHSCDYIIAAPRRVSREGCLYGPKARAAERLTFDTAEEARQWMRDLQDSQRAAGCRSYQIASAYPVQV